MDKAVLKSDSLNIEVSYCRPFKKDRLIFGPKGSEALEYFGEYWRTGANAATEITFSENVIFKSEPVNAGTYVIYTIPEEKEWTIVLNSELGRWGAFEADTALDLHKIKVPALKNTSVVEQFTIDFDQSGENALLQLMWDETQVNVPIRPSK